MKEITKIEVLSLGKVQGITMALLGIIIGLFVGLIGITVGSLAGSQTGMPGMFGAGLGIFAIIVFPIMYGVIGFIFGILGAAIYNLVAKWVGGIEIELKDKQAYRETLD
jgi:hypothetical protein